VIALAYYFGIEGVAVAADVMLFVGVALIMHQMRRFVDFSLRRMFAAPLLALLLAAIAAIGLSELLALQREWPLLIVRAGTASAIYLGVLLVMERSEYREAATFVLQLVKDQTPRWIQS
jgi:hypothetical protein